MGKGKMIGSKKKNHKKGLGMGPDSQDFAGSWAEGETMKRLPGFPRGVITDPRLPEFRKSLEKALSGIFWGVLCRAGAGLTNPFGSLPTQGIP